MPPGAWDTHLHVFETSKFPLADGRHFTPAPATLQQLKAFEESIGVQCVCIAHGLSYGADCNSLLHFIAEWNKQSTTAVARGICVLDLETVTDDLLDAYHAAGVRSVRLDFFRHRAMQDVDKQADLILKTDERLSAWLGERGRREQGGKVWSIQIQQPRLDFWPRLREVGASLKRPLVVDHLASLECASLREHGVPWTSEEEEGFSELLQALREGNTWMKISAPYRCSDDAPMFQELKPIVRRIVDANPRRVVWGSDWPHTQRHKDRVGRNPEDTEPFLKVDDGRWVESLSTWLSDDEWKALWVENPCDLYDFV